MSIRQAGGGRSFKVERRAGKVAERRTVLSLLFSRLHLSLFLSPPPPPSWAVVSQAFLVQEEIFLFGKFNKLPFSLYRGMTKVCFTLKHLRCYFLRLKNKLFLKKSRLTGTQQG